MASEVDICNLALSHLGDTATVASIDPPEGSAQAEHCARFYPQARDALLGMHSWGFATRRAKLAELVNDWEQWRYAYAKPADCVTVLAVLDVGSMGDFQVNVGAPLNDVRGFISNTPQDFTCEIDAQGQEVIFTNQEDAMARYIVRTTDTTRFPQLFIMALSHMLASMLAGPIIKGDAGKAESKAQMQLAMQYVAMAVQADVGQQNVSISHSVGWIAGR